MHKIFHKNCLRTKPKFKIDIHKNFIIFFYWCAFQNSIPIIIVNFSHHRARTRVNRIAFAPPKSAPYAARAFPSAQAPLWARGGRLWGST